MAVASQQPHIQLFDPSTGKLLHRFDTGVGVSWSASWVSWSPDGKTLACCGWDERTKAVQLLDAASGEIRRTLKDGSPGILWWLPDGNVWGYDDRLSTFWQWDADSGRLLKTWIMLSDTQSVAIGPDGHYRGTPEVEQELVYVVQTDRGQQTLTPEEFAAKYGWMNDPRRVRLIGAQRINQY